MRRTLPLLVILAACGSRAPAPAPAPVPPPAEPEEVAGPDDPILLDAGEEPRHRLRYGVAEGARREHVMEMAMTLDVGGQEIVTPPMAMLGWLEVRNVASDGTHTQVWVCERTEIRPTPASTPAMNDAMRASMKQLEGMRMRMRYTGRGKLLETETTGGSLPAEAQENLDQVSSNLRNLITTLPVEAIGVGARWATDQEQTASGMTIQVHTETEVVDISGTGLRLRGRLTMTVPRQDVQSDQGPIPMQGSGGGTLESTIDLATLESTMSSRIELEFVVDPEGAQPVTMRMGVEMSVAVR
jgi:hypothetical protein